MENKDARIFVTSVGNISKRLEHYGDANMDQINLLKLIYKYSCYATTYSQLQRLDSMVAELQRTSSYICNEFQAAPGYVDDAVIPVIDIVAGEENNAPTITGGAITVADPNETYTFTVADLFSTFSDPDGHGYGNFVIKVLPSTGSLAYNGVAVTINTLYSDPTLLVYTRTGTSGYSDPFDFAVYDNDSQLPLESNTGTMAVTVEAITQTNQPATVGDRAEYSGNRSTTVFAVADFTTEAIAPYFDPEGNDLDAIRIDEISDANTGVFYYFGNPVVAGQVITATELANGAFYHVGPDVNSISTDSFNASVRDTGSMIWVS